MRKEGFFASAFPPHFGCEPSVAWIARSSDIPRAYRGSLSLAHIQADQATPLLEGSLFHAIPAGKGIALSNGGPMYNRAIFVGCLLGVLINSSVIGWMLTA